MVLVINEHYNFFKRGVRVFSVFGCLKNGLKEYLKKNCLNSYIETIFVFFFFFFLVY